MNGRDLAAAAVALALSAAGEAVRGQRLVPASDPKYPKVKYADSLIAVNDRCAVRRNPLSTHIRPVYVNDLPVGFCCSGCPPVFSKEPEKYLKEFHVQLADPTQRGKKAVLDSTTRAYVGQDIYFFADARSMEKFKKSPLKYSGPLTDPVSGLRFLPTERSPKADYNGRSFYFRSDSTRLVFNKAPMVYASR